MNIHKDARLTPHGRAELVRRGCRLKARPFDKVGHRITGDRTGQSNSRGIGWEFVHVGLVGLATPASHPCPG